MKKVKNYENLVVGGEYFDGSKRFLRFQGVVNNHLLLKFIEIDEEGEPKKEDATLLTKEEVENVLYINYEPETIFYTAINFFYELDNLLIGDLIYWGDNSFCKVDATEAEKRWLTYVNNDYFFWEVHQDQTQYLKEYMKNHLEYEDLIWVEKWDDVFGWVDYDFPQKTTVEEYAEWCIDGCSDFFPTINTKKDVIRLNLKYTVDGAEIFGGDED